MVPGEITSTEPEAESETQHKVVSTVFMEGEAAEAQPTEIRRRNKELRDACISYFRTLHEGRIVCECCGFDFAKRYDIDKDYIEVHHRFPFSQTEGEHPVDAVTDLVPLCANCHRMIHFGQGGGGNCMSLEDLKKKLR
jgi:predicted HNH restriction endonuclease